MAKMMMYPKIHNEQGKAFEVFTFKNHHCPMFGDAYQGEKMDGEGFHCYKTQWFMVKSDIDTLGEPTPEEDEAFNELDKKLNPEPDYADTPFAVRGRILERMGKAMQDKNATVHDLAKISAEARMSVYFKIQPIVE